MTSTTDSRQSGPEQEATVVLRRRVGTPLPLDRRAPLGSARLGERYGASPDDLTAVQALMEQRGLRVLTTHPASRRVRVAGPRPALTALATDGDERIVAVLGLDEAPRATPRSIIADPATTRTSYTPLQLAEAYGFPDGDGTGQTIAIIELGGGFDTADLDHYFSGLDLQTPQVRAVGVDGAQNQPGQDPQGADGEVLLDIEVAGAIAPAADLVVYFAPNSDAGFHDAIAEAAHADPAPVSISISWGQSEDQWSASARKAMDQAIEDATAMGITVTAAAGDDGSTDRGPAGTRHADFPASSPHALGCGGTTLDLSATGQIASEVVWNDKGKGGATGGGVSDVFDLPDWQQHAGVPVRPGAGAPGRGVPDVAANADPDTGYQVRVDGKDMVIGGTSAVAPLWAGLVARLVQAGGQRVGLAQAALYAGTTPGHTSQGMRDITSGSNGAWQAGPGWDPCTGLGVPQHAIAQVFSASP